MRKILVAYDGSEGSEKAFEKALSLLDPDGEIILLAVTPKATEKLDRNAYKETKKKAKQLISDKIKIFPNVRIRGIVKEGDAAEKIIETASKRDCDLIVLGRKGISEIGSYLLGSVADRVVKEAHKTVMLVK
ncbi:MAG: universal stress protein [Thermoplasmata archaeon]|nr:universal stress protein [Thermoplasmata archaeon]